MVTAVSWWQGRRMRGVDQDGFSAMPSFTNLFESGRLSLRDRFCMW